MALSASGKASRMAAKTKNGKRREANETSSAFGPERPSASGKASRMAAKTKNGKRREANEARSAFDPERPSTSGKANRAAARTKIGKRREANAEASSAFYQGRRKAIVDAAAAAFQERGYEATTLADVAEKLNTDRASLYYYFGSKEQLFREIVREGAQRSIEVAEAIARKKDTPAKANLIEAFRAVMGSYSSTYPHMHVFLQENFPSVHTIEDDWNAEARQWARRYYYAIRSIIQQGVDDGSFKLSLSVGLTTMGVLGTVNWAHRWYKPGGRLAAEDIGEGFADMILNGLAAEKA